MTDDKMTSSFARSTVALALADQSAASSQQPAVSSQRSGIVHRSSSQKAHEGTDAGAEGLDQASAGVADPGTYPITLTHIQGAPAVVVGGGRVAERKVRGLLAAGAAVRVVSPQATEPLRALAEAGRISWDARPYQAGDLDERPRLVFAATDQRDVNAQVARDAAAHGLLCNVADAPDEGSFHLPAVYRGAGVVLAVSTAGESPARAARVRDALAAFLEQNPEESL
jgi:siroheme synthase-like protein